MSQYTQLADLQQELRSGKQTMTTLVEEFLQSIEASEELNIFLEVFAHDARSRATVLDAKLKHGTAGALAGLIVGIKDNMAYKGHRLSAGSKMLENFESLYTATAVQRLLDEDAIVIGRLNCDEFAMGSSNRFSAYGPVKNPLDPSRVPGGSSGGSAAAVAAGLCHVALGSDTGGSIRQPASFTGILGLKPSYGRISRHGLVAFASSFDQIGPLAQHPADLALVYRHMAGPDAYDNTLSQRPVASEAQPGPYKLAYFKEVMESDSLEPELRASTEAYFDRLREQGHIITAVDFPYLDYLVPIYYILATAEASSNLARYDGIHYGYRSPQAHDLESTYKLSRTEGFGPEVKRRILLGTFVLSSGYYEAYYGKAQKARRLVTEQSEALLKDYDFIISPTTPHPAFPLDQKAQDPTQAYLEDIFTVHANITGLPAVSLPLMKHSSGLPLGLQLTGRRFDEASLLHFAESLMAAK